MKNVRLLKPIVFSAILPVLTACTAAPMQDGSSSSHSASLQPNSSSLASSHSSSTASSASLAVSSSNVAPISSAANSSVSSASSINNHPRQLVYAVNVGGPATIYEGVQYKADENGVTVSGGRIFTTNDPIENTDEDTLFQSQRYGAYTYNVPVTNATYSVELHFVEMYHTAAGRRSFNAIVEDNTLFTQLDLFAEVGHDKALTYTLDDVTVADQTLSIKLETLVDNGTLSGFSIWSSDGGQYLAPPEPEPGMPNGPYKIHAIGDSITEAYELESAWRYWLWQDLAEENFSVDFVGSRKGTNQGTNFTNNNWDKDHDGHTSATSSQVLNGGLPHGHTGSLKQWAPQYKADIAVILLGTNDIRANRSTQAILDTFKSIIAELRAANADVDIVICQIPYWNYGVYKGSKNGVDSLNAAIPSLTSLATARSQIKIVDLNAGYSLNDHRDGIHPNSSGAKKIAERLLPVISGFMQ